MVHYRFQQRLLSVQFILARDRSVFILLSLVALIVYGNILPGDFVFDDNIFIENNVQIRSLTNAKDIYTSSTTEGSGLTGDNFYRPNQQFIYTVIYSFFGLSPFWFHLAPIFFHIINGYLIFLLFGRLGITRQGAFFGSLLFLLHPILTQAVSYVSGLSEPLVLTSILGTLLLFDKSSYLLALLVFALGLFSKESQSIAVGLVTLLAIYKYRRGEVVNIKKTTIFVFSLMILSLTYFIMRPGELDLSQGAAAPLSSRLLTFLHVLPQYFKMLFWPWHLYYEKPYFFISSLTAPAVFGIVLVVSGLLCSLYSLVKQKGELFFGLGWFAAAIVPFIGLTPLNAVYLEHWLYVPMVGLVFCLAYLLDRYKIYSKKVFLGAFMILLFLFGLRIAARNIEWGDPVRFYENELRYVQTSARIYNNLGMELSDRGDCVKAMVNYKKAIELSDSYPQTHHNLARCLERTGSIEEAIREYNRALLLQPNFPYSLNALRNLLDR